MASIKKMTILIATQILAFTAASPAQLEPRLQLVRPHDQYIPGTTLDYDYYAALNISGHLQTYESNKGALEVIRNNVLRAELIQSWGAVSGEDNISFPRDALSKPGYHWEIVQKIEDLSGMLRGYYELFDFNQHSGVVEYAGEYCGPDEVHKDWSGHYLVCEKIGKGKQIGSVTEVPVHRGRPQETGFSGIEK